MNPIPQCIVSLSDGFTPVEKHWLSEPHDNILEELQQGLRTHPEARQGKLSSGWTYQIHPHQASGLTQVVLYGPDPHLTRGGHDPDFFAAVFEHASIGMAVLGLDGRWLTVNNALCRMLGYGREELLALTFQDIIHPDDPDTDLDPVHSLLESKMDHFEHIKRCFTRPGDVLWIKLHVSLIHHADGTPRVFVAQIQAIEHQDHLEALNAKMDLTHRLTRTAGFTVNLARGTLHFSRSIKPLLGHHPGTLQVSQLNGWFTVESHQAFQALLKQTSGEVEVSFRTPQERRWVIRLLPHSHQDPTRVSGVVQDVTLLRQQEKNILELQKRWELALEANQDGLWDARAAKVDYSPRWKALLGLPEDFFDPSHAAWLSRVHPEDLPEVQEQYQQFLDGHSPGFTAEYRMLHEGGHWIWVNDRAQVVERAPDGQATRVVGTLRDITLQKQQQVQLQAALQYSEALTEVARIAAHTASPLTLAQQALAILARVCKVDWAALIELHPNHLTVTPCWASPNVPADFFALVAQSHPQNVPWLQWVMEQQLALLDDLGARLDRPQDLVEAGVTSMAVIALKPWVKEHRLYFTLKRFHDARPWTQQDRNLLETAVHSINTAMERQQNTLEMEQAATVDALTGLWNRRKFHLDVQVALTQSRLTQRPFGLLNIDLDGLKRINDQEGHARGDHYLILFGQALKGGVPEDATVYRLGGDEFMVILMDPQVDVEHLVETASGAVRDQGFPGASASWGLAVHPEDGVHLEVLMQQADQRMYQVKHQHHQLRS